MLKRAAILIVFVLAAGPSWAQDLSWATVLHDGVARDLAWYAGVGVGAEPAPVVLVLHGGGGSASRVWQGGCVAGPGCERGSVLSTEDTVAYWIDVNAAEPEPICIELPDSDPDDGSTVAVCTWSGAAAGSEVVLYTVDGGGHTVPGPDDLPWWYRLLVGPKNHDISAPDEIWTFFERHRRVLPAPRSPLARVGE